MAISSVHCCNSKGLPQMAPGHGVLMDGSMCCTQADLCAFHDMEMQRTTHAAVLQARRRQQPAQVLHAVCSGCTLVQCVRQQQMHSSGRAASGQQALTSNP
jgi:hypothetical protein